MGVTMGMRVRVTMTVGDSESPPSPGIVQAGPEQIPQKPRHAGFRQW